MDILFEPLPREEVIKAVERRQPARIPLVQARWWGEGLVEQYGERLQPLEQRYPEDAVFLWLDHSNYVDWGLPWELNQGGAFDSHFVIDDWGKLDDFIAHLPQAESDPRFETLRPLAEQAHRENRYLIFAFWRLFFERPWEIRGMQNLLMDYYTAPAQVHKLYQALCEMYTGYLRRAIREFRPDGFWTSDDLGHQRQLFMSPKTFRSFLKPYYQRIGAVLRPDNVHWWLHSCGNNTVILDDLVESGVTVFHPVQKGTMDEAAIAQAYGDRLTFLAGFDVQHILQEASPAGVRAEVRHIVDTFDRPEGGLCLAAGNGIVAGTPLENISAFLDEAIRYGTQHRTSFAKQHKSGCK
jgi:uroporphyrinogen decarboxylase